MKELEEVERLLEKDQEAWKAKINGYANQVVEKLSNVTERALNKKIPVMEVFGPTVQGEGMLIGQPTMFIRTGLCDYKCTRCDSLHAVVPELVNKGAMWITQPELVAVMNDCIQTTPLITLSGGNPCIHDMSIFIEANSIGLLNGQRRYIAVETQGSKWTDWLLRCEFVTISPKGPGMGEKFEPEKFDRFMSNLGPGSSYTGRCCVKVPVFDQRDIELIVEIMERWPETRRFMYISVGNVNPPAPAVRDEVGEISIDDFRRITLANYSRTLDIVMRDPRLNGVSVLPQLHTLVWGNELCR